MAMALAVEYAQSTFQVSSLHLGTRERRKCRKLGQSIPPSSTNQHVGNLYLCKVKFQPSVNDVFVWDSLASTLQPLAALEARLHPAQLQLSNGPDCKRALARNRRIVNRANRSTTFVH